MANRADVFFSITKHTNSTNYWDHRRGFLPSADGLEDVPNGALFSADTAVLIKVSFAKCRAS